MAPQQYLEQMVEQCEQMFRSKSRTNIKFERNDDLKLATIRSRRDQHYKSIFKRKIILKRLDIEMAMMTQSLFRSMLRHGHLEHSKHVVSYLKRFEVGKYSLSYT